VGIFNLLLLSLLRDYIPRLFTPDEDVIRMVSALLPLCATFQVFDALAANCNGILRGLGRQEIGGYVGLFAYYVVGIPISFGTGFGAGWGLYGLWSVSLCLIISSSTQLTICRVLQSLWASSLPSRVCSYGERAGSGPWRLRS
jgi:Na+-driven multidrug efflux pump